MKVGSIYSTYSHSTPEGSPPPPDEVFLHLTSLYDSLGGEYSEHFTSFEDILREFNAISPPYLEFLIIKGHGDHYFAGFYPVENFETHSQEEGIPWVNDLFTELQEDSDLKLAALESGLIFSREFDSEEEIFSPKTRLWECGVGDEEKMDLWFKPVWRM